MKNDKLIPDSPSPLEEEFQYEFTELIDQYKKDFLTHGWSAEELAKWCKEMVDKELRESEDERIRKALIDGVRQIRCKNGITQEQMIAYLEKQKINTEGDFGRGYDCGYEACLNSHGAEWFEKQKEQKPAEWNANDKAFIKDCARILDENGYEASAERLLSMFPVKSAEWSEEDEEMWMDIKCQMIHGSFIPFDKIEWLENRIKSLRPSWKPSEEQLNALNFAITYFMHETNYKNPTELRDLYDDLLKLK